jgi:hypothetical protein
MVLPPSVALLNRVFLNCASKRGLFLAIFWYLQAIRTQVERTSCSHVRWRSFKSTALVFFSFFFFYIFKAKLIEYLDSVKKCAFFTFFFYKILICFLSQGLKKTRVQTQFWRKSAWCHYHSSWQSGIKPCGKFVVREHTIPSSTRARANQPTAF